MTAFSEDVVEQATLAWFEALDYEVLHGPDIAPGERAEERATYEEVILRDRFERATAQVATSRFGSAEWRYRFRHVRRLLSRQRI